MSEIALRTDQFLELQKIGVGAFAPLTGFMTEDDSVSVVERMRLADGTLFSLPVYLDVPAEVAAAIKGRPRVTLTYHGTAVGELDPQSLFQWDRAAVARKVFGVDSADHPGVAKLRADHAWMAGGPVRLHDAGRRFLFAEELSPAETRARFAEFGWTTVAGFQTRNVPHRAHEYLQRVALEVCDGLFIQPLLGRKKAGDYTPDAIMSGYRTLVDGYFPARRVLLGVLSTAMRYAGPREALFHALIRRNYGCTHFVVGRDHAGVGSYYGTYDAHAIVSRFTDELGIAILALRGPFYCRRCGCIATDHTCRHGESHPADVTEISGTLMRRLLSGAERPHPELMRPDVVASLAHTKMFVEEDEL